MNQSAEVIANKKVHTHQPGINSPLSQQIRRRKPDLFLRMQAGEFEKAAGCWGQNRHGPFQYAFPGSADDRILKQAHHRTGSTWNVYPLYDFAHGQCDYFEGITHSLCTLEFEIHRPLYDWFTDQLKEGDYRPRQIEFNRLNMTYTIMSKRKMLQLVKEGFVRGWDDPRMPTLCGLRRRGYTPQSIRNFVDRIGYTKFDGVIDQSLLEFAVREHLNKIAPRVSAVLNPVRLIITNYPEGQVEWNEAVNNPEDESAGRRQIPFARELYVERDDFMEEAPKKFYRLTPGQEVS
jgi:glutaminyl-tRNA synthetase